MTTDNSQSSFNADSLLVGGSSPAGASNDTPDSRLATRLAFAVVGFGMACWAPLVPYAKLRTGVSDGHLGLLLLSLGIGSLIAMQMVTLISSKVTHRTMIVTGGLALAVMLPCLALASHPWVLAMALLGFGASLGMMDVSMNVHAIEVDADADKPLISGFHGMFSVGGFIGAGAMTALLSAGVPPLGAVLACTVPLIAAILVAWPRLLRNKAPEGGPKFAIPRGIVLLIAILASICFLSEGAMLDWGALLLTSRGVVPSSEGGLGYMIFAIAMTVGRLSGDKVTAWLGDKGMLLGGGMISVLGMACLLLFENKMMVLASFFLIGIGEANIVPILFRRAGSQKVMPAALAVAAISTLGYAGVLIGPAGIGFVAQAIGLTNAFWILAVLLLSVPLAAKTVTRS